MGRVFAAAFPFEILKTMYSRMAKEAMAMERHGTPDIWIESEHDKSIKSNDDFMDSILHNSWENAQKRSLF